MERWRRTIIVVAAVVTALALLWWRRPATAPSPAAAASTAVTALPGAAEAAAGTAAGGEPIAPDVAAPIIDKVVVEKSEVCEGEENLVTVYAHAADAADDDHLHAVIDGVPGMSVPLVAHQRGPDSPPRQAIVFGRGNTRTTVDLPRFEVRDCTVAHRVEISYRLNLNTNAEFELDARLTDLGPGQPFDAVSYQWDFGDGTTATTAEPSVVHDYGQRPQVAVYSNLLVQVTARSSSREVVLGRKAILFHNPTYANLEYAGVVTLVVELTPRFPTIVAGRVVQGLRLWHHRPEPVRIDRIRARRNSSVPGREPVITEVAVASILGATAIPPSGLSFDLTLDVNADPDLLSIDYLLDGESAEGYPVESTFSVMKPPVPTPEHHTLVDDPALVEKILLARELLGKDLVTDEDLLALQRRGAFDGFKPVGADPDPKLPPAYPR